METTTTTSDEVRERRGEVGLTQRQLATLAGCSLTFLTNIENGCVPRKSPTLERVLAALSEAEQRTTPDSAP
jgi:predicted transcriptional regulator